MFLNFNKKNIKNVFYICGRNAINKAGWTTVRRESAHRWWSACKAGFDPVAGSGARRWRWSIVAGVQPRPGPGPRYGPVVVHVPTSSPRRPHNGSRVPPGDRFIVPASRRVSIYGSDRLSVCCVSIRYVHTALSIRLRLQYAARLSSVSRYRTVQNNKKRILQWLRIDQGPCPFAQVVRSVAFWDSRQ